MRTERSERWSGPNITLGGVLLVAVVLAAVLLTRARPSSMPGAGGTALPDDVVALGDSVAIIPDTGGYIGSEDALAIAQSEVGERFDTAKVAIYLVHIKQPDISGLQDRDIWLVKASGLSIPLPGPVPAPGTTGTDQRATVAYVFLDATTGEFITAALYP